MSDIVRQTSLLSPAGARVVTDALNQTPVHRGTVAVPRRGASCYSLSAVSLKLILMVAVPRRDASCYVETAKIYEKNISRCCPPQGREVLHISYFNYHVTKDGCCPPQGRELLPAIETARMFGAPGCCPPQGRELLRGDNLASAFIKRCCPPQGREVLLYCYYNTRFAPNQPLLHILCRSVSKPSSFATGCKTRRHKL